MNVERVLMLGAPIVAMAAVAFGLDFGARSDARIAVVYASAAGAGTRLAWQLVTFDEVRGAREPVSLARVEVAARAGGREVRWSGPTNEDGVAEVSLEVSNSAGLPEAGSVSLEVRAEGALLAEGTVERPAAAEQTIASGWAAFARREGAVLLDVAVLGQRVASGFPASIWVRATDAATHSPVVGAAVQIGEDSSLLSAVGERTDAQGWAHIVATPMGLAVGLVLDARAPDGRTGRWAGALFVSPGAFELGARDRYSPGEELELEVVAPNLRRVTYLEVDDARGRVWGAAVTLASVRGEMPHAKARIPALSPGLYWAVVSSDPAGAATMGGGTIARPFFVGATDELALAILPREASAGSDPARAAACNCSPGSAGAAVRRVLQTCLAVIAPLPVARWTAVEGVPGRMAGDAKKRVAGLALGLSAIGLAVVLEAILVLRASRAGRARLPAAALDPAQASRLDNRSSVLVGLFVALLGFALLAALLLRAA